LLLPKSPESYEEPLNGSEVNVLVRPQSRYSNIDKRSHTEQESEELGKEVIARLNPATGEIEDIDELFFSQHLEHDNFLELPVTAELLPIQ